MQNLIKNALLVGLKGFLALNLILATASCEDSMIVKKSKPDNKTDFDPRGGGGTPPPPPTEKY